MLYNTATPETTLESRLEVRAKLQAIIEEAEGQLKAENDAIKKELMRQGVDDLVVNDQRITLAVCKGRETLDKGALVQFGVSTDIIKRATKTGADYVRLTVREVNTPGRGFYR